MIIQIYYRSVKQLCLLRYIFIFTLLFTTSLSTFSQKSKNKNSKSISALKSFGSGSANSNNKNNIKNFKGRASQKYNVENDLNYSIDEVLALVPEKDESGKVKIDVSNAKKKLAFAPHSSIYITVGSGLLYNINGAKNGLIAEDRGDSSISLASMYTYSLPLSIGVGLYPSNAKFLIEANLSFLIGAQPITHKMKPIDTVVYAGSLMQETRYIMGAQYTAHSFLSARFDVHCLYFIHSILRDGRDLIKLFAGGGLGVDFTSIKDQTSVNLSPETVDISKETYNYSVVRTYDPLLSLMGSLKLGAYIRISKSLSAKFSLGASVGLPLSSTLNATYTFPKSFSQTKSWYAPAQQIQTKMSISGDFNFGIMWKF